MNCQPSFVTGSVPLVGPALDGLGWLGPAVRDGTRDGAPAATNAQEPHRRVPDCDIVDVGCRARATRRDEALDVLDLTVGKAEATASASSRKYTKALLAFLILQITAAGGLYLKKRYAETQVIVIPATINERAVIT